MVRTVLRYLIDGRSIGYNIVERLGALLTSRIDIKDTQHATTHSLIVNRTSMQRRKAPKNGKKKTERKLYIAIDAWLNLPNANSPMKAPARTERKYPTLYVMTANILWSKR